MAKIATTELPNGLRLHRVALEGTRAVTVLAAFDAGARANDQPATVAEHLIDRAAFGDHPLGRSVLGPEEHLRSFTRDGIVAFRERRWSGACGGAFLAGNLDHLPGEQGLKKRFG